MKSRIFLFILISVFSVATSVSVVAQDIHFSQYDHSPLIVNPALAGVDKHLQATLQHKDQWKSLNGYRTSAFCFEMKFDPRNWVKVKNKTEVYNHRGGSGFAFGLNIFSDKAGDSELKQFVASLALAYHVQVAEHARFSAGIQGGIIQRSFTPDALRFNSQYGPNGAYDPGLPSGESFTNLKFLRANFSLGALYSFDQGASSISSNDEKSFKLGVAVDHLNRPDQTFIGGNSGREFFRYTLHSNAMIGIRNTPLSVGPLFLFNLQGAQQETNIGLRVKYAIVQESKFTGVNKPKAISLTCYYRINDAVVPTLMYELNQFSISVGYDLNASSLTTATKGRGGFEFGVRFYNITPFLYQNKGKQGKRQLYLLDN